MNPKRRRRARMAKRSPRKKTRRKAKNPRRRTRTRMAKRNPRKKTRRMSINPS